MVALVACHGTQYLQLLLHRNNGAAHVFCREKCACICGQWHSNGCAVVVDPGSPRLLPSHSATFIIHSYHCTTMTMTLLGHFLSVHSQPQMQSQQ